MRESIAISLSPFISYRDLERETEGSTKVTMKEIHRHRRRHFLLLLPLIIISSAATLADDSSETDVGGFDYGDALSKSLLYFEAQRSGRLPYNQRVTWRDHSGLTDGLEQGVCSFYKLNSLMLIIRFFLFVKKIQTNFCYFGIISLKET